MITSSPISHPPPLMHAPMRPYAALKPLWISWSGCTASTAVGGGILYPESPYSHHISGTRISSSLRALTLTAVVACRTEVATWGAASHMWCPGVSVPCPCLLSLSLVFRFPFLVSCAIAGSLGGFPLRSVVTATICSRWVSGVRCSVSRLTRRISPMSCGSMLWSCTHVRGVVPIYLELRRRSIIIPTSRDAHKGLFGGRGRYCRVRVVYWDLSYVA